MPRKLKVGDKVRIIETSDYNGCFSKGDIVYVVEDRHSATCPYFLSKHKSMDSGGYFGPYRHYYEYVPRENIIGGKLL